MLEIQEKVLKELKLFLQTEYQYTGDDLETFRLFSFPPREDLGDLSISMFTISNKLNVKPNDLATMFVNYIQGRLDFVVDIKALGPYVNLFFDKSFIFKKALIGSFKYPNYGDKTVVIDYSSPNIAKPIAVHHIRSTVIGNIIGNMFEKSGAKTVRINYLGDWGTQFGKLIVAYKRWGSEEKLNKDGIKHLLEIYIQFHKEETEELLKEARLWFKKTEDGDAEALRYWEKFRDISIKEFDRIYNRLNIKFTNIEGESFYRGSKLNEVIDLVDKKLGVEESEGADIVDLSSFNMPPLLLRKTDGSTLYATRDLAAAIDRYERFKFDELLYVVASQQDLHFKQVFKTLELMGYEWASHLKHINFGLLTFPGGKMSTRDGKIIFLEEVLDEATDRVLSIINEKNPDLDNKHEVADIIGTGAVIFSDISRKRKQNIVFNWNEILNFDGETAPYVQYTYARANGVLRKNKYDATYNINLAEYTVSKYEFLISKKLLEFELILSEAISTYEPFVVARYVLDLAKLFNKYYNEEKIADIVDNNIKQIKLRFIAKVMEYIKELLDVLGIKTIEKM